MVKTATINICVDPQVKSDAESIFASLGMTLAEAIDVFLRKSLMVGGLPFDVKQPRRNTETGAAMRETRDVLSGNAQVEAFGNTASMPSALDKHDERCACETKAIANESSITIQTDAETIEEAARIAEYFGLDLPSVTRAFYKQIVREGRIPLSLSDLEPNDESLEAIRETEELLANGGHGFKSAREMFDAIGV